MLKPNLVLLQAEAAPAHARVAPLVGPHADPGQQRIAAHHFPRQPARPEVDGLLHALQAPLGRWVTSCTSGMHAQLAAQLFTCGSAEDTIAVMTLVCTRIDT